MLFIGVEHFTFQSGYIQMDLGRLKKCSSVSFTFQSGYIQISLSKSNAHSLYIFTFQSGYIQILILDRDLSSINRFTFQSGYIQMQSREKSQMQRLQLYIPIWLYSNMMKERL